MKTAYKIIIILYMFSIGIMYRKLSITHKIPFAAELPSFVFALLTSGWWFSFMNGLEYEYGDEYQSVRTKILFQFRFRVLGLKNKTIYALN